VKTLVIAPHPDDELLGCGGTLLRRKKEGGSIGWLVVTGISTETGWSGDDVRRREREITEVRERMGFDALFSLGLPPARLDTLPLGDVVTLIGAAFREYQPDEILLPHRGDVHSDHRVVFEAVSACTKWFRYPSVRRVLAYETLSETGFALARDDAFVPNYFVDIGAQLEDKLALMSIYSSELGRFPFPRSIEALRALAAVRGAESGSAAAEAFELLRERT
jgi:LmbE family N-acetylglucosaminyl deacetylase